MADSEIKHAAHLVGEIMSDFMTNKKQLCVRVSIDDYKTIIKAAQTVPRQSINAFMAEAGVERARQKLTKEKTNERD